MNKLILGVFLFLAFLLQGTFTTLPLIIDVLILYYVFFKEESTIFLASLIAGIFLDSISVRTLGVSSLFLVLFLFIVMLYQRKFEINTWPFVFFSSFLGGFIFLTVFGYQNVFVESLFNAVLTTGVFMGVTFFIKSKEAREL